jgi:hypothetical protein
MKRQVFGFSLLAIAIGLIGMLVVQAQRKAPVLNAPNPATANPAIVTDYKVDANYRLSGPYSHKNLAIFLIHGADAGSPAAPLTLKEAMEQKKVVVHETGEVNQLAIENVSNEEVFVQSGDIVKGGQQDRVLAIDLIVPARSGKIPIESFCVEQGRWARRGDEVATAFSASEKMLNTKELKIAAKHRASQEEVWQNVAKSQDKMSAGVIAMSPAAMQRLPADAIGAAGRVNQQAAGGGGQQAEAYDFSVASSASRSSLQLALENKTLNETAGDYLKQLSPIINNKTDVIGYAFAINGQLNSADVYSSHALFKKLWPKLLEANVTEAIGEFEKDQPLGTVTADEVKAFLNDPVAGKAEMKNLTARVTTVKRETLKNLFFETRDRKRSNAWVHRNYIAK